MHLSLNSFLASSTFGKLTLSSSGGNETPSGRAFLISLIERSVVFIAANAEKQSSRLNHSCCDTDYNVNLKVTSSVE